MKETLSAEAVVPDGIGNSQEGTTNGIPDGVTAGPNAQTPEKTHHTTLTTNIGDLLAAAKMHAEDTPVSDGGRNSHGREANAQHPSPKPNNHRPSKPARDAKPVS